MVHLRWSLVSCVALAMLLAAARLAASRAWAAGCTPPGAHTHGQPVSTPEEAVCAVVAAMDGVYAGDCAATVSPRDIGKVCSKFIAQRGALRAYLIGRTFSEFSTWVFVERQPAGWVALTTVPLDFASPVLVVPWPERTVVLPGQFP